MPLVVLLPLLQLLRLLQFHCRSFAASGLLPRDTHPFLCAFWAAGISGHESNGHREAGKLLLLLLHQRLLLQQKVAPSGPPEVTAAELQAPVAAAERLGAAGPIKATLEHLLQQQHQKQKEYQQRQQQRDV